MCPSLATTIRRWQRAVTCHLRMEFPRIEVRVWICLCVLRRSSGRGVCFVVPSRIAPDEAGIKNGRGSDLRKSPRGKALHVYR